MKLPSGLIKGHQNLSQPVSNDILKEDDLGERKVRRNKARLEKLLSKGNAEAEPSPQQAEGSPGHPLTDPLPSCSPRV